MGRKNIFTLFGIAFSFAIAIGGWIFAEKLLDDNEKAIFSKSGSINIPEPVSAIISELDAIKAANECLARLTNGKELPSDYMDFSFPKADLNNEQWMVSYYSKKYNGTQIDVTINAFTGQEIDFAITYIQ